MNILSMARSVTHYLRVSEGNVLQLEINCLEQNNVNWLNDRHIQEILMLLQDTVMAYELGYSVVKKNNSTKTQTLSSGILTGNLVRIGYMFRKRVGRQTCIVPLSLLSQDKGQDTDDVRDMHILQDKLVVYTHELVPGTPQKMSKLLRVIGDNKHQSQSSGVSVSNYFRKISTAKSGNQSNSYSSSKVGKDSTEFSTKTENQLNGTDRSAGNQTNIPERNAQNQPNITGLSDDDVSKEAPPSEGRRTKIRSILSRKNFTKKRNRGQQSKDMLKSSPTKKISECLQRGNVVEESSTENSNGRCCSSINDNCGESAESSVAGEDSQCSIGGVRVTRVDKSVVNIPYMKEEDDPPDTVTVISVEQMHDLQKTASFGLISDVEEAVKEDIYVGQEMDEGDESPANKVSTDSSGDVSVFPSASFCVQSQKKLSSALTKDMLKKAVNISSGSESSVTDSPTFSRTKISEKVKIGDENRPFQVKQNQTDGDNEASDSSSVLANRHKSLRRFRFKRKLPNFSDSDSEEGFPDKKLKKTKTDNQSNFSKHSGQDFESGGQSKTLTKFDNQSKFADQDQIKITSRKLTLSSSFFSNDGKKQPKLSFFMSKSRQEKAEAADPSGDKENEQDLQDIYEGSVVKNEEDENLKKEIQALSSVRDLNEDQIRFMIRKHEKYLRQIFEGKIHCARHEAYKKGGKSKRDLSHESCLGQYTDEQVDAVMQCLLAQFCKNHSKYLDYVMKVLLPEILIQFYMDIHNVSHSKGEEDLGC